MRRTLVAVFSLLFVFFSTNSFADQRIQEATISEASALKMLFDSDDWLTEDLDTDVLDEDDFTEPLPESFSLKPFMTPAKSQKGCASWPFTAIAAFEGSVNRAGKNVLDLSEQLLISTCFEGGDCGGSFPKGLFTFMIEKGVPEESCYPLKTVNSSCSEACDNWEDTAIKAAGVRYVKKSIETIKGALYAVGPVWVRFNVYDDFYGYSSGVYERGNQSKYLGTHQAVVVGWDDKESAFLVKNSWGSGWGEKGYFRIAYNEVKGPVNFGHAGLVFQK